MNNFSKGCLRKVLMWAKTSPDGFQWNVSGSKLMNTIERVVRDGQMSYSRYSGINENKKR